MDYFQLFTIASPFIAAGLTSLLSYAFTTKAKRKEYLYQNRVDAFKLIAAKISKYKVYCLGKVAFIQGNEFSPYYEETGSTLTYRREIAVESEVNELFLSPQSRESINQLLNNMSMLCNVESHGIQDDYDSAKGTYEAAVAKCNNCLNILYTELDLN